MKEEIKDLIFSITSGNAAETEERLNGIMSQKVISALDDFRVEVARDMFNKPETVAEGPGFDKWADERAASQLHKLNSPRPKTWHDVDKKLGQAVDKMSQAEKVKKGFAHPDTLKKGVAEGSN